MSRTLCLMLLTLAATSSPPTLADDPPPTIDPPTPPTSLRVTADPRAPFRDRLARKLEEDFNGTPLETAIEYLRRQGELPILVDAKALEEEGIPLDEPVRQRARGVSIATTLDRLVEPLGLTWFVKAEVVFLTSAVVAEELSHLELAVYDTSGLIEQFRRHPRYDFLTSERVYPQRWYGGNFGGGALPCGLGYRGTLGLTASERLSSLIVSLVGPPESWEDQGGPGSIQSHGRTLVVRQTTAVQSEIDRLLPALQQMAEAEPGQPTAWPLLSDAERNVLRALDNPVTLDVQHVPLVRALAELERQVGIDVLFDQLGLEEADVSSDRPVTISLRDVTLRSALRHLLEPLDLDWRIDRDALEITGTVIAQEREAMTIALLDARDLQAAIGEEPLLHTLVLGIGPPESWMDQGGPGGLATEFGGVLVVLQTPASLLAIESLLADLRRNAPPDGKDTRPKSDDVRLLDYTLLQHDPGEIADLVRETVAPDSWQGLDPGTIRIAGRQLYVRTTLAVHERIHELLWTLQPARDPEPNPPAAPGPAKSEAK